jgi:hypothetical protein
MIYGYNDFVAALHSAGFSMGGGNSEGIYSVILWGWNETPPYDTPVRWHTGELIWPMMPIVILTGSMPPSSAIRWENK